MAYYDNIKKMNDLIDKIIEKNDKTEVKQIYYYVNTIFGFSKIAVDKRLDILVNSEYIKIDGGIITKNDKKHIDNPI